MTKYQRSPSGPAWRYDGTRLGLYANIDDARNAGASTWLSPSGQLYNPQTGKRYYSRMAKRPSGRREVTMTKTINNWPLQRDGDGQPYTATFGPDEFETWWLAGMEQTDLLDDDNREELLEALLYLAEAEGRVMTQNLAELREVIKRWADDWNEKAADLKRAAEEEG